MWHRTNGHMVQRGFSWIIATLLGTVLASCGVMADDNQARPSGETLGSESVSEGELGAPEIAEDGRMLQPRGHEGLWFETEPADPWERYVWLSQKYVGDPVHLGQLAEGEVAEGFVGEPDICSDEVVARMGEIGFKKVQGMSEEKLFTCDFEISESDSHLFPALLTMDMFQAEPNWEPAKVSADFGPHSEEVLRRVSEEDNDLSCAALAKLGDSSHSLLIYSNLGFRSAGVKDACRRAYLSFWILNNIGVVEGY